jgi:hypothetical protein
MAEHELDALIVSGNEYSGFEGAVTYVSGFQIVHRYAYVVVPAEGEPQIVFPTEARYVGEHRTAQLEQVFHDRPGEHIAATATDQGWRRIGVYGLDYIMTVRDFRALEALDLVPFDAEFDLARAVKSEAELESVRESVRINEDGFEAFLAAYEPGKTAAEAMAAAEKLFIERGCGRLTMNMVLRGPEFGIARKETTLGDFVLPSLEVAGPGMHWVEVSRAIGNVPAQVEPMVEAYGEYHEAAREAMRDGARRSPRGVEGIHRARVSPRSRDRALDRDDHDRVPEARRGRRDRVGGGDGLLLAPARDLGGRPRVPVHAGHVARHRERRRAACGPADEAVLSARATLRAPRAASKRRPPR